MGTMKTVLADKALWASLLSWAITAVNMKYQFLPTEALASLSTALSLWAAGSCTHRVRKAKKAETPPKE